MNEQAPPLQISVIIPVYNDAARLRLCLASLEAQTFPRDAFDVIVVDNGSEDHPERIVAAFPGVRLLHEPTPGSYAARNTGIHAARGAILAFLDSDIEADPSWLAAGVAALKAGGEACGCVGGRVAFSFQTPGRPTLVERYDSLTSFNQAQYIHMHGYSGAGNLLTSRSTFLRVGLFDASLKSGGDKEWGQRLVRHGYELLYEPDAVVYHPARFSLAALIRKTRRRSGGAHVRCRSSENPFRMTVADCYYILVYGFRDVVRFLLLGETGVGARLGLAGLKTLLVAVDLAERIHLLCPGAVPVR